MVPQVHQFVKGLECQDKEFRNSLVNKGEVLIVFKQRDDLVILSLQYAGGKKKGQLRKLFPIIHF